MIVVSEEVREAPAVVALETTLVAHGFPAGEGLAVGLEAERSVRAAGAVPAMPSPPASSSAATLQPRSEAASRLPRAASRPWARCLLE